MPLGVSFGAERPVTWRLTTRIVGSTTRARLAGCPPPSPIPDPGGGDLLTATSTVPAREPHASEVVEHRAFFVLMAVVSALIVGAAIGKGLFLMGGRVSCNGSGDGRAC